MTLSPPFAGTVPGPKAGAQPGFRARGGWRVGRAPGGFTMIEIMIVIAIMALVLAVGVPSIFRAAERDSLRAVVVGIVEACSLARAQAILTGQTVEMVINLREGTVTAPGKSEAVQIPERILIELLGVNFVEMQEAEEARVRFFPNSTCDEFTILLKSDRNEYREISLDVVTALADVKTDPNQIRNH